MSLKALVFDMDGTILDTLPDLTRITNMALAEMGFPARSQEEVLAFVGNGAELLIAQATPADASDVQRERTLRRWREIYLERGDALTRPFPGVADALRKLRARGLKTAVLSNKFDAAVRRLAEKHYPGLFDIARGEIPPIPRKPDPTSLLQICDKLGLEPSDVAYVGDTSVDVAVARNAGTFAIGVSWGYDKALPLPVEELDAYVHDASELVEIAERLGK